MRRYVGCFLCTVVPLSSFIHSLIMAVVGLSLTASEAVFWHRLTPSPCCKSLSSCPGTSLTLGFGDPEEPSNIQSYANARKCGRVHTQQDNPWPMGFVSLGINASSFLPETHSIRFRQSVDFSQLQLENWSLYWCFLHPHVFSCHLSLLSGITFLINHAYINLFLKALLQKIPGKDY